MDDVLNTYKKMVLQYMRVYGSITQVEASDKIGCTDLAGVICPLRKNGYLITDEWIKGRNRWGRKTRFKRYYLIEQEAE